MEQKTSMVVPCILLTLIACNYIYFWSEPSENGFQSVAKLKLNHFLRGTHTFVSIREYEK